MLAQNFKTPGNLGITDAEFDALLKVLGMLEREEIQHAPGYGNVCDYLSTSPTGRPVPVYFNMGFVTGEHDCGTAGCILGWAQHVAQGLLFQGWRHPAIDRLFQMGRGCDDQAAFPVTMENILPSHAAIALRNYLTHGEPRWEDAFTAPAQKE